MTNDEIVINCLARLDPETAERFLALLQTKGGRHAFDSYRDLIEGVLTQQSTIAVKAAEVTTDPLILALDSRMRSCDE